MLRFYLLDRASAPLIKACHTTFKCMLSAIRASHRGWRVSDRKRVVFLALIYNAKSSGSRCVTETPLYVCM
jgi:hypothetical protein